MDRPYAVRVAGDGSATAHAFGPVCTVQPGATPGVTDTDIRDSSPERWVLDFAEGSRELRDLLGGKGANVAEMTHVLGADLVPGGFTITTAACVAYMHAGGSFPTGLAE